VGPSGAVFFNYFFDLYKIFTKWVNVIKNIASMVNNNIYADGTNI